MVVQEQAVLLGNFSEEGLPSLVNCDQNKVYHLFWCFITKNLSNDVLLGFIIDIIIALAAIIILTATIIPTK